MDHRTKREQNERTEPEEQAHHKTKNDAGH